MIFSKRKNKVKNLIYKYWDGNLTVGCKAGSENMKQYANRIGADYLFEHNPRFVTNLGPYSPHYGAFKPVFNEKFHVYDNVLFADTDVFAVDGLTENIFENFNADIGICTEPLQPKIRVTIKSKIITKTMDEQWAKMVKSQWHVEMPRTEEELLKVYNSGVVLYSNKGLLKAKERFVPFKQYVDLVKSTKGLSSFYTCDQPYLHAMLKITNMDYVELSNDWNALIHYLGDYTMKIKPVSDPRTKHTKFVHIQMRGADHYDAEKLWKITNLPVEEWGVDYWGNRFIKARR